MVDLSDAVSLLQAKRKELLAQLEAVDKALAALSPLDGVDTTKPGENHQGTPEKANTGLPTRLKPSRTLSDEHKHALNEGRRKARHSKDAAAGLVREMLDPSPGLAPSLSAKGRQPRLVKRTRP